MEVLAGALAEQGFDVSLVDADAVDTDADLVVLDSYRRRADELPARRGVVAAVDDLARNLAVDVLVDPSPGAQAGAHTAARTVLAGVEYALADIADRSRTVHTSARDRSATVLVTTGAADAAGVGAAIAADVVALGARVRLVVGQWGAPDVPAGAEAVVAPDGLRDELDGADIVVTAGGVTMIEALGAGRATVAVVTAENQRTAVDAADVAGAVRAATPGTVASVVAALLDDAEARDALGAKGRALVDGRGPQRVAEALRRAVDER